MRSRIFEAFVEHERHHPVTHRLRYPLHVYALELDELPVLAEGQTAPLRDGMTVALEPKAVFPGRGVVGIENTHVVTSTGLRRLTELPDSVVVV